MLGPKNFGSKKKVKSKKNLGPKMMIGPKKIYVQGVPKRIRLFFAQNLNYLI